MKTRSTSGCADSNFFSISPKDSLREAAANTLTLAAFPDAPPDGEPVEFEAASSLHADKKSSAAPKAAAMRRCMLFSVPIGVVSDAFQSDCESIA